MAREKKFIQEKMDRVLLKEFLKERTERAGFGGCDVSRTPMGTRITLHIERPSLVIGRKGRTIRKLTSDVKEKFKFDNPQIEVQEVTVPELNPQIMAEKLAQSLERGWHFRRAGHSTVRRIMDAGARGCQIILSGKITGPRHRVEKFKDGHIKYCGEEKNKWMHEGYSGAKVKLGMIGVTVQIMDPNAKLPDEIEIIPPKREEPEEVSKKESEEVPEEEEKASNDDKEEKEVVEESGDEDESKDKGTKDVQEDVEEMEIEESEDEESEDEKSEDDE
ncbi:MAG: 30S ribosomal protein S3 [Thermoplasmatota archaeon]